MSAAGTALVATHVVLLGWLAAKFRAECGLPFGAHNHPLGQSHYDGPLPVFLWIALLGGLPVFGGNALMVMTLVTAVVLPYGFFNVPGLGVELLEVGRRFRIRTTELAGVALLGFVLAIGVGGWLYLTTLYGFGATRLPVAADFGDRIGAFQTFNAELSSAQSALDRTKGEVAGTASQNVGPYVAMAFGAALTTAIGVLRQVFPGFWFHPVGLLMGPSGMMKDLWGSLLLAALLRYGVLKLGGAKAVRERLVPAAVGILLAALLGYALYIALNGYYLFFNKGSVKFRDYV
jgi:hypothetical protein